MNQIIVITIIVVGVLFLIGLVMVLMTRGKGSNDGWQAEVQSRILAISKSIDTQNTSSLKMAIMEYDKLVDLVLQKRGARGTNLGERLKSGRNLFSGNDSYQQMWNLHKERNRLAHEFDYNPGNSQLLSIVSGFRRAIEQLAKG